MNKRNRITLNESQLRGIIRESIKKMLCEYKVDKGTVYGHAEYDPYDRCLSSDQFDDNMLEDLFGESSDVFDVQFVADYYNNSGDYYNAPENEFDGKVDNDDGAMDYIQSIPNEEVRNFLLNDFEEWCDETSNDYEIYENDRYGEDMTDYYKDNYDY